MKLFIVDDNADRGSALLKEATKRENIQAVWVRPKPRNKEQPDNNELQIDSRDDLVVYVSEAALNPAVWLWDIELTFVEGRGFGKGDYKKDRVAFSLLKSILDSNGVIVIISSDYAAQTIVDDLVIAGCNNASLRAYSKDFDTLFHKDGGTGFCSEVIEDGLSCISGGIRGVWTKPDWQNHFRNQSAVGAGGLPHTFDIGNWEQFLPIFAEVLGGRNLCSGLITQLKKDYKGYFEATKTLIGAHAKCHSDEGGYAPSLSVLSILLLRAALLSGVWEEDRLIKLAYDISPKSGMKDLPLSDVEFQTKGHIQRWLEILADKLFPILVTKKFISDKPSDIDIQCDQQGQFFRMNFPGSWGKLAATIHDYSSVGEGDVSRAIRELNIAIGDCGPKIGRRQICTVNAWISDDKTSIEFCTTL